MCLQQRRVPVGELNADNAPVCNSVEVEYLVDLAINISGVNGNLEERGMKTVPLLLRHIFRNQSVTSLKASLFLRRFFRKVSSSNMIDMILWQNALF